MEAKIEDALEKSLEGGSGLAVTKHIREVRVNYRGPKLELETLLNPRESAAFIRKVLPDNSREHLVVLFLDGAHQVISYSIAFTGTANSCNVHPREVFQRAVLVGAIAIVVAHNHPSGKADPSEADHALTNLLKKAGDVLGIRLLDHVIVTSNSHYSFAEKGSL